MTEKRYGVLCRLPGKGKDQIVLITRQSRKDWIHPKGRRIPGMSGPQSARREAYEEGGLRGRVFARRKVVVICGHGAKRILLTLYDMRVDKLLKRWPESRQRERIVVSVSKAGRLLSCAGMRRGMHLLQRQRG